MKRNLTCTLKIRLSSGESYEDSFDESDTLEFIKKSIEQKIYEDVRLSSGTKGSFKREDYSKTLKQLGLTPKGVIMVSSVNEPQVQAPLYNPREYDVTLPRQIIPQISMYYPYVESKDLPSLENKLGDKEFAVSWTFEPSFIDSVCYEGCFPMSIDLHNNSFVMAVKLHNDRCVLDFSNLHVPKRVRQNSKKFEITFDTAYDKVMTLCHAKHGENWLCSYIRKAFTHIHQNPSHYKTKFHSVELWQGEELVAGELGYRVGGIYTSLTGAYNLSSAGSVQLIALGKLLQSLGIKVWDFGMVLDYKEGLGAKTIPRRQWLQTVREERDKECNLVCSRTNAQLIINFDRTDLNTPTVVLKEKKIKNKKNPGTQEKGFVDKKPSNPKSLKKNIQGTRKEEKIENS